jgi:hypothetical protein
VVNPAILSIHLRTGDTGVVDDEFIDTITLLSKKFQKVIIFAGVHSDERFNSTENNIKNTLLSYKKIIEKTPNAYINYNSLDNHIAAFQVASNVLLHKDGISTLISVIREGGTYTTKFFRNRIKNHPNWIKSVNKSNFIDL